MMLVCDLSFMLDFGAETEYQQQGKTSRLKYISLAEE